MTWTRTRALDVGQGGWNQEVLGKELRGCELGEGGGSWLVPRVLCGQ